MSKPPFAKKDDKKPAEKGENDKKQKFAVKDDGKDAEGADEEQVADKKPMKGKGPPQEDDGEEVERDDSAAEDDEEAESDEGEEESSIKPKKYTKGSKNGPSSDNSDNNDAKGKTKVDLKPKLETDDQDDYRTESRADKVLRIAREYRGKTTMYSIDEAAAATYKHRGEVVSGITTNKVDAPIYNKEKHDVFHDGEHIGHVFSHETSQVRKKNSVRMQDGGKKRTRWGYQHKTSGGRYSDLSTKKDAVEELFAHHTRNKARQS